MSLLVVRRRTQMSA